MKATSHMTHHPDESTLLAYAAGTLDEAFVIVVASHIAHCPDCRAKVRAAESLGGALLEEMAGAQLSEYALERALSRIGEAGPLDAAPPAPPVPDSSLPLPLERHLGASLEGISWRMAGAGVRMHKVRLSDGARGTLHLMRIEPGRKLPEHGHGGMELTMVLKGSYTDSLGSFGPGDVADLDAEVEHCPVVEPGSECICIVATEAPTRFRGFFSRLLQPLVGI